MAVEAEREAGARADVGLEVLGEGDRVRLRIETEVSLDRLARVPALLEGLLAELDAPEH